MPDYNKGDFTQQGCGGYVSGGLHLNEKRCLTAKISTDEDSAGLDSVEINIHDHLNDLDYTFSGENVIAGTSVIGQAPSGNIEITENTAEGSPLNIAQYATATVNVAGGVGTNLLKTTVTLINPTGSGQTYYASTCIIGTDSIGYAFDVYDFTAENDTPIHALVSLNKFNVYAVNTPIAEGETFIFDLYYMLGGAAPLIVTQASDASNIVNLDDGDAPDYEVLDSTSNSSITLTFTGK